jgi:hypothetical protein
MAADLWEGARDKGHELAAPAGRGVVTVHIRCRDCTYTYMGVLNDCHGTLHRQKCCGVLRCNFCCVVLSFAATDTLAPAAPPSPAAAAAALHLLYVVQVCVSWSRCLWVTWSQ